LNIGWSFQAKSHEEVNISFRQNKTILTLQYTKAYFSLKINWLWEGCLGFSKGDEGLGGVRIFNYCVAGGQRERNAHTQILEPENYKVLGCWKLKGDLAVVSVRGLQMSGSLLELNILITSTQTLTPNFSGTDTTNLPYYCSNSWQPNKSQVSEVMT